jgi:hypothetical protein
MNIMKFRIIYAKDNQLHHHFTCLNCLILGKDKFPYNDVEILDKSIFTGWVDMKGNEIYPGDEIMYRDKDGEDSYLGVVTWLPAWTGWAVISDNDLPTAIGEVGSTRVQFTLDEIEVVSNQTKRNFLKNRAI